MEVFVATWSHKYGEDINVFKTQSGAENWRQTIAAEEWTREMSDSVAKPSDPKKAADTYFEAMADVSSGAEFFDVRTVMVGD